MIEIPQVALSVQQPWAWLIVNGIKDVENRTWWTSFRGPVAIHAGKKIDTEAVEMLREEGFELPERFETGGIVGVATVTDCVRDRVSRWFCGPFGFVMAETRRVEFVPCRGMLGFFKWAPIGAGALDPEHSGGTPSRAAGTAAIPSPEGTAMLPGWR